SYVPRTYLHLLCLRLMYILTSTRFPYTTLFRSSLIIFFNQRILGKRKYETVGGKDSSNKLIPLGKWKKPTVGIVGTFVAMISVVDRKSTRLNYSHVSISYADFCFKKKINIQD